MAAATKTVKKSRTAIASTAKKSTAAKASKASKHQAAPLLEAHGRAIDALHKEACSDARRTRCEGKAQLKKAVEKVKKAHGTFVDDVLYCIPTG